MADDKLGPKGDDERKRFRSRLGPPPSRMGGSPGIPERQPRREDTSLAPVRRAPELEVDSGEGPVEPATNLVDAGGTSAESLSSPEAPSEGVTASPVEKEAAPAVASGSAARSAPDEAAGDEAPADEAPADEAPADEAPADEVPADEAPGAGEEAGFDREAEPTVVSNDLTALRRALQQRRAEREAQARGRETSPEPPAPPTSEQRPDTSDEEAAPATPDSDGARPDPKRSETLVFDAQSIRRALDDLEDADALSDFGDADSSDDQIGASDTDAHQTAAGDQLRSTGLLELHRIVEVAAVETSGAGLDDDAAATGGGAEEDAQEAVEEAMEPQVGAPAAADDRDAADDAPHADRVDHTDDTEDAPDAERADGADDMDHAEGGAPDSAPASGLEPVASDVAPAEEALPASVGVPEEPADVPASLHLSETLLIDRAAGLEQGDTEHAAGDGAQPWEDVRGDARSGTLVLTSEAFAAALAGAPDESAPDDGDDAHGQQSSVVGNSLDELLLDDPDAPSGPVHVVAERTELTPFDDDPPMEPAWGAGARAAMRDDLALSPERFWPDMRTAQDDRTSVEPTAMDDDAPATTAAVPVLEDGGSMDETLPGFGIGEVDIDDLDPGQRENPIARGSRVRETDDEDRFSRLTSPQIPAPWSSRAREMETHILAMDAGDEPAWTTGPERQGTLDLDARSVDGPAGSAVARPANEAIDRSVRPSSPQAVAHVSDAADAAQVATSFLRAMVVLALLVLLGAFAIPSVVGGSLTAPWKTVSDVQSLSFLCALLFSIYLVVAALPMPLVARAALLAAASAVHLGFGGILLRDAALRFAFHGHPAVDSLFAVGMPTTMLALLAAVVLPAGLYARGRYTASLAARVTVGVGMALALLVLLGWGAIAPGAGEMPLTALYGQAMGGASLQGDRVASFAVLVAVGALLLSGLAFLGARRTGLSSLWAFLWSFSLGSALIIEAVHVAHLEHWREGLEPTKLAVFVAAGLLLAPVALGMLIGALAPGKVQRR